MDRRSCRAFVLAGVLLSQASIASSLSLNEGGTQSSIFSLANDGNGLAYSDTAYPIAPLPAFGTSAASHPAGSHAVATYHVSDAGFDFQVDLVRTAASGASAVTSGSIHFVPAADLLYEIAGTYAVTDPGGRRAHARVELLDTTTGDLLFQSLQDSRATPNELFTIGATGGDFENWLVGSPSGALIAGHGYAFVFSFFLVNGSPGSAGASAMGEVSMTLVPEPGTMLLVAIGIAALSRSRASAAARSSRARRPFRP